MHCSRFPYALFGLPFDSVSLDQTKSLIRKAIKTREQLVIATPNVNFVALASKDKDFYQSIIECDLSVVDGTPLYWLLCLLKAPLPEKVAGSSLIESFIAETSTTTDTLSPIKAFFFGGEGDAGAKASAALNQAGGAMRSVGDLNPGFGSIETMSSDEIINTINQAGPDFLIVSLGAKKGHRWIQHNRHKLTAPVISHLGAVVNFVAGTKKRSPQILQQLGLEWLWRIYQEPSLYKRYCGDAVILATLIAKHYCPALLSKKTYRPSTSQQTNFDVTSNGSHINYTLIGQVCEPYIGELLHSLQQWEITSDTVFHFDMSQTTFIDSHLAGALLRLKGLCDRQLASFKITQSSPDAEKMLRYFMINI